MKYILDDLHICYSWINASLGITGGDGMSTFLYVEDSMCDN